MLLHPGKVASSPVTNLNPQPYPGADFTGKWNPNYATGGAGSAGVEAGGILGLPFYRMTWSAASTEVSRGAERTLGTTKILTEGQTYTVSAYVRVGRAQSMILSTLPTTSNGAGIQSFNGATISQRAGDWYIHSVTLVAPANSHGILIRAYSSGGTAWAVGDTLDFTAVMITEGATPCAYFDGNTVGASWSGEVNNSTSTTRAIQGAIPLGRVAEMGRLIHTQGVAVGSVGLPVTVPIDSPTTIYTAHVAGTTSARANFLNGTSSVIAAGRTSSGAGWFMLAMNSSGAATTATLTRATGPNVVAGVREQSLATVHSFVGNTTAIATVPGGWPPADKIINTFNAASDVRNTEIWGAAHLPDIRYARMALIRTAYGIS